MKRITLLYVIISSLIFALISSANAEVKCGPEWELGRAIQVAPTNSSNSKWPKWKGKLGKCVSGEVSFSTEAYFNSFPSASALYSAFGTQVHADLWYNVSEKSRTYFVFESDWQKWNDEKEKKNIAGTMSAINSFLLSSTNNVSAPSDPNMYPSNLAYTPDNPNPYINEGNLSLSTNSWQKREYVTGEMYAQIEVRNDGTAKMKFGKLIDASTVQWFDVRKNIPVSGDWYVGITPFILSDMFTGYIFKDAFYPGDDRDIWAARIFIPGYKNTAWTPSNPKPAAANEENIILNEYSWQNMYPVGSTYCQISLRGLNLVKIKFGIVKNGHI